MKRLSKEIAVHLILVSEKMGIASRMKQLKQCMPLTSFHIRCSPEDMRTCWPATNEPDVISRVGWQVLRLMSIHQGIELRARLAANVERLDTRTCRRIAEDLQLSHTQVGLKQIQILLVRM